MRNAARNAITGLAAWLTFGLCLIGADAANAQSVTLTSANSKEGRTLANEHVLKGVGCTGSNVPAAWGLPCPST